MAIIIPSKNIYDIENTKIRDNVIDNVSVDLTVVTQRNDYETLIKQIERKEFVDGEEKTSARIKYAYGGSTSGVSSYYALSASYLNVSTKYTNDISIEIRKLLKNAYISKIYDGKNSKDEDNIKFTVYQKVKKFDVSMIINHSYTQGEIDFMPSQINEGSTPTVNTNGTNSIPTEYIDNDNNSIKISQTTTAIAPGSASVNASISNSISVTNQQNISNKKFYTVDDTFRIDDLIFLSGIVVTKMKYEFAEGGVTASMPPSTITLTGTREYYIPQRIEISIYGDTIGIDLIDGSITYGSGNKPFSLSGNELMQASNYRDVSQTLVQNTDYWIGYSSYGSTYYTSVHLYNPYPLDTYVEYETPSGVKETAIINAFDTTHRPAIASANESVTINKVYTKQTSTIYELLKQVQKQYAKGKEMAVIRCSISDYYDENGIKVIDTKSENMSFRLHNQIVPYVYGANGFDKPMSKNQDNYAKVFEVIGSNIIYDGAVWQELTSQEFGKYEISNEPDVPEEKEQLSTPIISLSGDILQITDISGLATSFDILVYGVIKDTTKNKEYDLTLLNLSSGTHSIKVVAKASGYVDSEYSNTVTYTIVGERLTLEYSDNDDGTLSVSGYLGNGNIAVIPFTYNNKTVKTIGNSAFNSCSSLIIVEINGDIVSIGSSAFYGCNSLQSITMPNSVTSIGSQAFSGCTNLPSIVIPENIKTIEIYTFYNCSSLTSITIPSSVRTIGNSAFNSCSSLTKIIFNGTKSQWNKITKNTNWNKNTGNYTIYCTDGEILK